MNAPGGLKGKSNTGRNSLALGRLPSEEYRSRRQTPHEEKQPMKRTKINPAKPAAAGVAVEQLTPQSDPPLERRVHTVTLSVGGRRYEMTWHTEFREITHGPAQVIEMPVRSATRR
jgi:hypothetical protein